MVENVTPKHIWVEFPWRYEGPGRFTQHATRAWWDLCPRDWWLGCQWKKPKPRKGYGTGKNAALAAALMGVPSVTKRQTAEATLFQE